QGLSLTLKKETDAEYDEFRGMIINPFVIKVKNKQRAQLDAILKKFNRARRKHSNLFKENKIFGLLWDESNYVVKHNDLDHGFKGWYRIESLRDFDGNLRLTKYTVKNNQPGKQKSEG